MEDGKKPETNGDINLVGQSTWELVDELGGGFYRSKTIDLPTNITMDIYRCCLMLFNYSGKTVRSISVTLSNIEDLHH